MLGVSATTLVVASALVLRALAHGGVLSYSIAGTWYDGWKAYNSPVGQSTIQRPWDTYNPVQGPTTNTLACNGWPAHGHRHCRDPHTVSQNTWPYDTLVSQSPSVLRSAAAQTTYAIPVPPLYGAASAPPSNRSPGSTAVPTSPATTNAPSSTAAPGNVAHVGQCGGIGHAGATGCVAPFVCTALNDYYSQCI
ncbi:hypothetical protein EYR40_010558 [Pleurotus pulmonarius]|nr:hypothetical protein EYR36_010056 [Pleurotus pulmonarius]KAF4589002.1 hypothetical protein EYR40_010558 [Pleurotus pulmonarius]